MTNRYPGEDAFLPSPEGPGISPGIDRSVIILSGVSHPPLTTVS